MKRPKRLGIIYLDVRIGWEKSVLVDRRFFMAIIAAIRNVLSPISETKITAKLAINACHLPLCWVFFVGSLLGNDDSAERCRPRAELETDAANPSADLSGSEGNTGESLALTDTSSSRRNNASRNNTSLCITKLDLNRKIAIILLGFFQLKRFKNQNYQYAREIHWINTGTNVQLSYRLQLYCNEKGFDGKQGYRYNPFRSVPFPYPFYKHNFIHIFHSIKVLPSKAMLI
jgi:hypothetical protein